MKASRASRYEQYKLLQGTSIFEHEATEITEHVRRESLTVHMTHVCYLGILLFYNYLIAANRRRSDDSDPLLTNWLPAAAVLTQDVVDQAICDFS
jgi:hypothetical protein